MSKRSMIIAAGLVGALGALAITASISHSRSGGGGWHAGYGHAYGYGHDRRHARRGLRKLRRVDANEDGKVTLEEFVIRSQTRLVELDTDANGELSADELAKPMLERADYKVRRMVKRFDADGDGKITQEEFSAPARKRFAKRDFDGDGKISDNERPPRRQKNARGAGNASASSQPQEKEPRHTRGQHRARHGKHGRGHHVRNLKEVLERRTERFAIYDGNSDGVIETTEIIEKGSDRRSYRLRRRLHVLDINKDGSVSKDEFLAGPKERFSVMDLNDDGAITADDLPPRMARRSKEKTSK